jgi:hypothetical protein
MPGNGGAASQEPAVGGMTGAGGLPAWAGRTDGMGTRYADGGRSSVRASVR